jgi:colanic acid biosynthesis protein WcaH
MVNSKNEVEFIPEKLFNKIVKLLPIASAEAVIVMDKKLLLFKRSIEPGKGEWWFPGGRIHKGEAPVETLRREIKEETDLEIAGYRLINVYSRVFPQRHDITITYLCKCKKGIVKLNDEHSEYAFFEETPENLHPFIQETLRESLWKEDLKISTANKRRKSGAK